MLLIGIGLVLVGIVVALIRSVDQKCKNPIPLIPSVMVVVGLVLIANGWWTRKVDNMVAFQKPSVVPTEAQAQAEPVPTASVASNEVIIVRVGVSGLTFGGTLPKPTNNMQSR